MEEVIEKISQKVLEELKKANKPPYPLYYRKIFNKIIEEEGIKHQINQKLLDEKNINESFVNKTAESLQEFHSSTNSIAQSSKELEEINIEDHYNLKTKIKHYNAKILEEVNKMEAKIQDLEEELEKVYKELLIDNLTKAHNRKALEKDLQKILEKGKDRQLKDLVVAAIDLDHFKQINDTYGHLVGDFVLIKFVKMIKSQIRQIDKIYRYGGDEFVVIFDRTNIKSVENIVKRIVNKISSTTLKYKDHLIRISTSIGITCHQKNDTMETILKRADEALYEAKKTRNAYKIKGCNV